MWGDTWGRIHRLHSVWGVVITTDLTNSTKNSQKNSQKRSQKNSQNRPKWAYFDLILVYNTVFDFFFFFLVSFAYVLPF